MRDDACSTASAIDLMSATVAPMTVDPACANCPAAIVDCRVSAERSPTWPMLTVSCSTEAAMSAAELLCACDALAT